DRRGRPATAGVGGPPSVQLDSGARRELDVPGSGRTGVPAGAHDVECADRAAHSRVLHDGRRRIAPSPLWTCARRREEEKRDAHEDREIPRCLAHTRLRVLSTKLGMRTPRGSLLRGKAGAAPLLLQGVTDDRCRYGDPVTGGRQFEIGVARSFRRALRWTREPNPYSSGLSGRRVIGPW